MDFFGVFLIYLIISYALCAYVVVSTVGDMLPKDALETRWKRFALWAVILAALSAANIGC